MEFDLCELEKKSFVCLDNCAMCCLCQPELSPEELAVFRKRGLTAGLTKNHIQGYTTDEPTAIKLQGGNGACHFLRDRRCTIHDYRPAFCRQFPVHLHALERVQLSANLSCRGITEGGDTLREFGNGLTASVDEVMAKEILAETRDAVQAFQSSAKKAGVFHTPEHLREVADALMPMLASPDGVGKLLAFADSQPAMSELSVSEIVSLVSESESPADLAEIASQGNYEQLELEKPEWQPIFVDSKFKWMTYRSEDGCIQVQELSADGTLTPAMKISLADIALLEPDEGTLQVFGDYAGLLNSRDHFLGYAYWMCEHHEYEHDLLTVYLGLLATAMLDLRWRACLVGKILGRETLDAELAMEGIKAFDMDCLDLPTMGAFF